MWSDWKGSIMRKRYSLRTIALIALLSLGVGIGLDKLVSADNIYEQIQKFGDVLSYTDKNYVEPVDVSKLTAAAITGMLNTLDPHSIYIPPKQMESVTDQFSGQFQGIGISFRVLNDTITVMEPVGGGPSARLGILSNDKIVEINDSSAIGFSDTQVMKSLRGPKGTKVKVTIIRPGVKDPLNFVITRDVIPFVSVSAALMLDDDVGYIKLDRFSETTHDEMERALAKLKSEGMTRLILDLRDNGGGYLEEAVRLADLFLDGGTKDHPRKIVYTKARRPELEDVYYAHTGDPYEKLPLIIMINHATASASEIVSGAVQDWDRGLIVGETSFGKGLVQRQIKLSDGSAFRITIAKYYTPSGRLIQRPYEGKDRMAYQLEPFEQKAEEGENVEHTHDASLDSLGPVYRTASGRPVRGGGGIIPDYVVGPGTATKTFTDIFRRGLFQDFARDYSEGPGLALRQKYKDNLAGFKASFHVTDKMLDDFEKFVDSKGVKIDPKDFEKDLVFIKARLKGEIASVYFGFQGLVSVMLNVDPQVQKALTLFPEAEKIAKLN
jgi:carboxyl-terminal processing protease